MNLMYNPNMLRLPSQNVNRRPIIDPQGMTTRMGMDPSKPGSMPMPMARPPMAGQSLTPAGAGMGQRPQAPNMPPWMRPNMPPWMQPNPAIQSATGPQGGMGRPMPFGGMLAGPAGAPQTGNRHPIFSMPGAGQMDGRQMFALLQRFMNRGR